MSDRAHQKKLENTHHSDVDINLLCASSSLKDINEKKHFDLMASGK